MATEEPFGPDDMTGGRVLSSADRNRLRREMGHRAAREKAAYRAGLNGEAGPDETEPDSVHQAYRGGLDEATYQRTRSSSPSSPSSSPRTGPRGQRGPRGSGGPRGSAGRAPRQAPRTIGGGVASAAGRRVVIPTGSTSGGGIDLGPQGASFLLGLVGYALVLSYALYGWSGVTGWLNAKFLNKVTIKGGATVTPAPAGGTGQPGRTNAAGGPVSPRFTVNPTTGGPTP